MRYEQEEYLEKKNPLNEEESFVYGKLVEKNQKSQKNKLDLADNDKGKLDEISKEHKIREFEQGSKEKADLSELLLAHIIEKYKWLGENCSVENCSQFDDKIGHSDLAIKIEKDGKDVFLALDITMSDSTSRLVEKINKIFSEIDRQNLGKLKYSSFNEGRKELAMVPRAIVKISSKELSDIVQLTRQSYIFNDEKIEKKLKENKLQVDILENIAGQLGMQIHYAVHSVIEKLDNWTRQRKSLKISREDWKKLRQVDIGMDKEVAYLANALKEAKGAVEGLEVIDSKTIAMLGALVNTYEAIADVLNKKRQELKRDENKNLENALLALAKNKEGKIIHLPLGLG
ncbi:MAG: hypothetical protein V1698_00410 [bacterium]